MNKQPVIQYTFLSVLCCMVIALFVFLYVRLHNLEHTMRNYILKTVTESELRLEEVTRETVDKAKTDLEHHLNEKLETAQNHIESELSSAIKKDFRNTRHTIQGLQTSVAEQTKKTDTIETTFTAILDEQKKQHISTVSEDRVLAEKGERAKQLFEEKEYIKAAVLWDEIVILQPDNREARFYALYARYIHNPADSSLYEKIIREFTLLEKNGYTRKEMEDILETVRMETSGAKE